MTHRFHASTGRLNYSPAGSSNPMIETPNAPGDPAPSSPSTAEVGASAAVAPEAAPEKLWIDELHADNLEQLFERASALRLRLNADKTRHHLVFDLLKAYSARGTELYADGILEIAA